MSDWQGLVTVWQQGRIVLRVSKRARSGSCVPHPDQFRGVLPAAAARRVSVPLGHQITAPPVAQRPLREYDQLCGVRLDPVDPGSAERPTPWAPEAAWEEVAG